MIPTLYRKLFFVATNVKYLKKSHPRICKCCLKKSLFISLGSSGEFQRCLFCGANLRYELMAEYLRYEYKNHLDRLTILELDPHSPLRHLFKNNPNYIRTFFSPHLQKGLHYAKRGRCEDVTALTFGNNYFDLVISSDVLEHVEDIQSANKEIYRVLAPRGSHLFTIPLHHGNTSMRAKTINGTLYFMHPPEYHLDFNGESGKILVYWHFGNNDITTLLEMENYNCSIVKKSHAQDYRTIFNLTKKM
ncbi:MAG: class I SAM-dependent methyltransferase [Oligoflexia bacterium]|nr:class I SAM-dependent methyltransferase [Oligoflexia bacterium]MBF0365798.1 class I SAM-dependent methyltransferase [Oligoflexia bacterium]